MAVRRASRPAARTAASGSEKRCFQCTESIVPWMTMPVSAAACLASSRLVSLGLSISTPSKPRDLISSNFSRNVLPSWIIPIFTAFRSFGFVAGASAASAGPAPAPIIAAPTATDAVERRNARRFTGSFIDLFSRPKLFRLSSICEPGYASAHISNPEERHEQTVGCDPERRHVHRGRLQGGRRDRRQRQLDERHVQREWLEHRRRRRRLLALRGQADRQGGRNLLDVQHEGEVSLRGGCTPKYSDRRLRLSAPAAKPQAASCCAGGNEMRFVQYSMVASWHLMTLRDADRGDTHMHDDGQIGKVAEDSTVSRRSVLKATATASALAMTGALGTNFAHAQG